MGRACQVVERHPLGPITIGFVWKQPSASLKVASLHTETSYRINRGLWPLYLRHGMLKRRFILRDQRNKGISRHTKQFSRSYISYIAKRGQMNCILCTWLWRSQVWLDCDLTPPTGSGGSKTKLHENTEANIPVKHMFYVYMIHQCM